MWISFHPVIVGDENRICAGRDPNDSDRKAMENAFAVVLPQGCTEALYTMATAACPFVFPNYNARFAYPGKTGQIALFQRHGAAIPKTIVFPDGLAYAGHGHRAPFPYPFVLKDDWGGEGTGVHLIHSPAAYNQQLLRLSQSDSRSRRGFLTQRYVPHGQRTLRVVIIGRTVLSYWRVQDDAVVFGNSLREGSRIDPDLDPDLQDIGRSHAEAFCRDTGIDLAGLDLMFPESGGDPLFLEINYFFGRNGLGGSASYYQLLNREVRQWLATLRAPD